MRIELPSGVRTIIQILNQHGHEAFAVGGCVRDSILNRNPDDWDITTSATPYQVKELFARTVDTGLQHGTVTVLVGGTGYEVTTYRIDGEYEDGRHPKEVQFTSNLTEDLKRRDFTINAMAYCEETGLIDQFGGMEDLEHKVIRCVGDPRKRFEEDALRILRAVRFAAQLGFTIEEKTKEAIIELAPTLSKISAERIQVEIVKLLVSDQPEMWEMVYETGITKVIMPEFDRMTDVPQNTPHHRWNVGKHTLEALKNVENDKILRLTMLMHDMGKADTRSTDENGRDHFYGHDAASSEIAKKILRRLKFDNYTIQTVSRLVYWHNYRPIPNEKAVRRMVNKVGVDLFPSLLKVRRADNMAQSTYKREEKLANLEAVERIFQEIIEKQQCVSLKMLAVTGNDLIKRGLKPGPMLGETLEWLLEVVLEHPEMNEKEQLLKYWEENKKKQEDAE